MLFHSLDFVIFFPVVVVAYFLLPQKLRNYWLLIASYYFYMNWNAKYALLLLGASLITYVGALCIDAIGQQAMKRRLVLVVALAMVFGILLYYKYTNFLLSYVGRALALLGVELVIPTFDIVLPVGISFFTFQAAGYLIDVYRGDVAVERNLPRYLLFVSFFPQLVAGPIERSRNLLAQMHTIKSFDAKRAEEGLTIMLWGYFLKLVIADRCATIVDEVFAHYWDYGFAFLFLGAILFSIQIYCDFMGYSTIARGAAMVLGFDLMENFCQPYFATSIKDFWRRWHISLSTWFKDYLYIPLGGNRCSKVRHYLNLMITFLVSGLWHGASGTFVLWGGIHGALQVLGDLWRPVVTRVLDALHIPAEAKGIRVLRILRTDVLAVLAWICFRADNWGVAAGYYRQMLTGGLGLGQLRDGTILTFGLNAFHLWVLVLGLVVLFLFGVVKERHVTLYDFFKQQPVLLRYGCCWGLVTLIMFSLSLVGQEFIYFQF